MPFEQSRDIFYLSVGSGKHLLLFPDAHMNKEILFLKKQTTIAVWEGEN
jgi:hypothetical protein